MDSQFIPPTSLDEAVALAINQHGLPEDNIPDIDNVLICLRYANGDTLCICTGTPPKEEELHG